MSPSFWLALAGTIAALCTTLAFVPQIVKIWKQGGRDLSYGMLGLYLTGVVLWFLYGVMLGASAVIFANAAATLLVGTALGLKRWRESRPARASRRERIAVDMDEVLADSLGRHLEAYNGVFDAGLTRADLDGRSLEAAAPAERREAVRELILQPGFFRDLELIPGSREVLRELAERYEVFIASAAMEVPTSFAAKYAWLREHFPFISPSHIVFCGDKRVLDVDYLVDDTPRHFAGFRGTPILFSAPHNRGEGRYLRAEGWPEVRRLLLGETPPGPTRRELQPEIDLGL